MAKLYLVFIISISLVLSCRSPAGPRGWDRPRDTIMQNGQAGAAETFVADSAEKKRARSSEPFSINTGNRTPTEILGFAHTLIGVPYRYASTDPSQGFDCSGFITYVFNHFGIKVPRSSVDFTYVGREVNRTGAKPGDLILFTGTDSTDRTVGHMGIVSLNQGDRLEFIHSSSGKANGVIVTPLERYYLSRFVKIIRIFPG